MEGRGWEFQNCEHSEGMGVSPASVKLYCLDCPKDRAGVIQPSHTWSGKGAHINGFGSLRWASNKSTLIVSLGGRFHQSLRKYIVRNKYLLCTSWGIWLLKKLFVFSMVWLLASLLVFMFSHKQLILQIVTLTPLSPFWLLVTVWAMLTMSHPPQPSRLL